MPPRLSTDARALLGRQRGLIADWQGPGLGVSRSALVRASRRGWMQVTPHVFADSEGDLTVAQLRVAGLLECGPWSVLGGRSALAEAGWRADDETTIEVLVGRGVRFRASAPPPWLRVHRPEDEASGSGWPARCAPSRAAIDAAAWARTSREVLFLLSSAVQQRLVSPAQLRRELNGRRRVRNAPAIRDALTALDEGVTTTGEARFLRECRRRGLGRPQLQVTRRDASGRRRVVDAEFRLKDGRVVMVEIDGVGHRDVGTWHDDLERHNDLVASSGAMVLRVTNWQIEHDPEPFFRILTPLLLSA